MTSQSRKSLRTTVRSTTASRAAINRFAAAALALAVAAGICPAADIPPYWAVPPSAPQKPAGEAQGIPGAPLPESAFDREIRIQDKSSKGDKPAVPTPDDPYSEEKGLKLKTKPGDAPYAGIPGRDIVFRLEGDADLSKRIARELQKTVKSPEILFPKLPEISPPGATYVAKTSSYPPIQKLIEPDYVVYRRLYFEEVNSERYGWDAGFVQPVFSTMHFYKDMIFWPFRVGSNMCERYDTSAGKCLPGSPVPYYLYPPEIDLWGGLLGAGFVTGVAVIVP